MAVRVIGIGLEHEEYVRCRGCGMILGYKHEDKYGVRTTNSQTPALTVICPICQNEVIVDELCFCEACESRENSEKGQSV